MAVFGETLRQARAYKGVTLKEAEQATRINRHHLAALEDENFAALPPLIYQRGIVRNYATYLDLDPNKLLTMFEEAHGAAAAPTDVVIAPKPLDMPSNFTPNFAIIAFLCVLSAILFAWLYSAYRGPADVVPTSTVPVTVTPLAARTDTEPISPTATATATAEPDEAAADGTPEADAGEPEDVALADEAENSRPLSRANLRRTEVAESAVQATTEAEASEAEATEVRAETRVNVPAATVGPTNTPTITPTPDVEATQTAEAVATEEAVSAAATQEALLTVSFSPSGYVWLTVVADGVEVFNNEVNAGEVVGPFDAVSFDIYTSDPSITNITNHDTNTTFVMGTPSFTLP